MQSTTWRCPTALSVLLVASFVSVLGASESDGFTGRSENPLAPFERLVGGQWHLDDSFLVFEWGVGRRSVKARSYFVVEGRPRLVSEAVWFWHPGEKRIKGFGTAIDMPAAFFDYTTLFDAESMKSELAAYSVTGERSDYVETWRFVGESLYEWSLHDADGKRIMEGTYERAIAPALHSHAGAAAADHVLSKEVVVPAPIESVWQSWTTAEGLRFISSESNVELEIGGPYEWFLDLEPDSRGKRGGEGARVLVFLEPQLLAFTWTFPPDIPELRYSGTTTHVLVRLEAVDDQSTRVRLDQAGWKAGPAWDRGLAYFDRAWSYVLGALREHHEQPSRRPDGSGR